MLNSQASVQPSLTGLCPVQPLDRVKFVPFEQSGLKPTVTGTVFHSLDTSGGNWRVRVVREGESFPHASLAESESGVPIVADATEPAFEAEQFAFTFF